jgi:hypothetical protein
MRKRIVFIQISIAFIIVAMASVPVFGASLGPLVQVSSVSPFGPLANCGNVPGTVGPPGTAFVDSEVEPWVTVNPLAPDNIVAFWQQDRWSNGGCRGNVAGVSLDGGATWQIVPVPGITDCTGGPWQRASDPWLSFSPDGTLHQMSLVFQVDPPPNKPAGFGPNGMVVSKSVDGGLNWSNPIIIVQDEKPRFLNDKNSLTADPTDADFVYAVWDKLDVLPSFARNPDRAVALGFKGAAMFARSTDGGDTWEKARKLYDPGGVNQTIGNQIVVLPDGRVIDFFNEILNFRNDDGGSQFDFNLSFKYSLNKGERWMPRGRPIRTNKIEGIGTFTPDDLIPVRDGFLLFDVAVDPDDGSLYAVWQDARFNGFDEVAFTMSTDGGYTWSVPIKINQTPPNANPLRQQAFLPSVEVAGDTGIVGVTYYDFRNDDNSGELADHWFVYCEANCSSPASWMGNEIRLTDASFDYSQAPFAGGLFLGDYVGLASDGTDFLTFFQQSSAADPADGYFRRVTFP